MKATQVIEKYKTVLGIETTEKQMQEKKLQKWIIIIFVVKRDKIEISKI